MKKKLAAALAIVLCLSLAVSPVGLAADKPAAPVPATKEQLEIFSAKIDILLDFIKTEGYASGPDDDPLRNAILDICASDPSFFDKFMEVVYSHYDQYSHYLPEGVYDMYYPKGEVFSGIGVEFDSVPQIGLFAKKILPGTPAAKAGILPGDQVIAVGGKDVEFAKLADVSPMLRGDKGTKVALTIRSGNSIRSLELTRDVIRVSDIEYKNLGDGIGYIKIKQFGDINTAMDFVDAYSAMPYEGVRSVILDVRDNHGGDLSAALAILDSMMTSNGTLMLTFRGQGDMTELVRTMGLAQWRPNKTVVLVNGESASASEIVAGVLSDLDLAELVGTKTFGKGCGQSVKNFYDTTAALITSFKVELPRTGIYDGIGIQPKYVVAMKEAPYQMPELLPMKTDKGIYPDSDPNQIKALKQRLNLLAYLRTDADGVYDAATKWAVGAIQRVDKLKVTDGASPQTLSAIEKDVSALASSKVYEDAQLDKAKDLLRESAKQPLAVPPPPPDEGFPVKKAASASIPQPASLPAVA